MCDDDVAFGAVGHASGRPTSTLIPSHARLVLATVCVIFLPAAAEGECLHRYYVVSCLSACLCVTRSGCTRSFTYSSAKNLNVTLRVTPLPKTIKRSTLWKL